MALAFQSADTVKQALFEELQNLLHENKEIRTNAEARCKQLEFTEGKLIQTIVYLCKQSPPKPNIIQFNQYFM